jgi:hypothetical protein
VSSSGKSLSPHVKTSEPSCLTLVLGDWKRQRSPQVVPAGCIIWSGSAHCPPSHWANLCVYPRSHERVRRPRHRITWCCRRPRPRSKPAGLLCIVAAMTTAMSAPPLDPQVPPAVPCARHDAKRRRASGCMKWAGSSDTGRWLYRQRERRAVPGREPVPGLRLLSVLGLEAIASAEAPNATRSAAPGPAASRCSLSKGPAHSRSLGYFTPVFEAAVAYRGPAPTPGSSLEPVAGPLAGS